MHNVYWNSDYMASEYAFDTTRKSGVIAEAIREGRADANLVDPSKFTRHALELIQSVHDLSYVDAVTTGNPRSLASSQGFDWDPGLPIMAIAHSAGLVAAVNEVLSSKIRVAGSLSSGLHHARAHRGSGFCTFNGLAVAVRAASALAAERIMILDFDAHSGGGTRSLTSRSRVVQIDVSTEAFDRWEPSGKDVLLFADKIDYLAKVEKALELTDNAGSFDLVLYNAGMDPVTDSHVQPEDIAVREHWIADWAAAQGHRLVYALAGGYTSSDISMSQLVDLHLLTINAFARRDY